MWSIPVLCTLSLLMILLLVWLFLERRILEPDKENPYTYKCRCCGQEYITIGELGTTWYDHLVPVGDIAKHNCRCHWVSKWAAQW